MTDAGWTWPAFQRPDAEVDALLDRIDWDRVAEVVVPCAGCGEPVDLLDDAVVPERPLCGRCGAT
jgi:ribosomal protein S27AE